MKDIKRKGLFPACLSALLLVVAAVGLLTGFGPGDREQHNRTMFSFVHSVGESGKSALAAITGWSPYRSNKVILYENALEEDPVFRKEFHCLAQAVYFEARSEPIIGQMAVAQVVLNRVRSKYYPDSICGVVFQNEHARHRCQFSFACDGLSDNPHNPVAWTNSVEISRQALAYQNDDVTLDATHYHADYVDPHWASVLKPTVRLGSHFFYRDI